jgi:hypothetical protein
MRFSSYFTGNTLRLRYRAQHRLMLFRETVAVYENHTEHTNTLCGQNIYKFSSYLTGNTSRLQYKDQPDNAV